MNDSFYKIKVNDSNTLIVSFAGKAKLFGGIQVFEFQNFFEKYFNNVSRNFYIDRYTDSYHKGISGVSTNIDETVIHLKNEIKDYQNVVFLGVSAGGYAAILFGSLLNITTVIAFIPQTIRVGHSENIDEKYRDISIYINDKTKYYIYGDSSISDVNDCHHISHCERISHHSNVFITRKNGVNLKKMRDDGELYKIIESVVL